MIEQVTALRRGDIVARGARQAVLWDVADGRLTLLPIGSPAELRHRADVEFTDADAVGLLASRHGVVRCGRRHTVAGAGSVIRVARLSPALIARIERSIAREAEACAIEATPPVPSHLTRCDGPGRCGRRVAPRGTA